MGDTSIEWTDKTWNPVTGCTKVSQGCKNCYAERIADRFFPLHDPVEYTAYSPDNSCYVTEYRERKFTDVRCHPDRLEQPLHWRAAVQVFVNSMSDLFHEDVPFAFIDKVFAVMALCPQHTFQILTKRAHKMRDYVLSTGERLPLCERIHRLMDQPDWVQLPLRRSFPRCSERSPLPNVWLGVSAEDQETANDRVPLLLQTPAEVRFISYEPALGPLRLKAEWLESLRVYHGCNIDWVIGGSESGPNSRGYETEWFANVARQCDQARIAFFMKQLTIKGRKIPFEEWPGYLQVREFPKGSADVTSQKPVR